MKQELEFKGFDQHARSGPSRAVSHTSTGSPKRFADSVFCLRGGRKYRFISWFASPHTRSSPPEETLHAKKTLTPKRLYGRLPGDRENN